MVSSIQTNCKRMIIARMAPGEDIKKTIEQVALAHDIKTGHITLIGAVSKARLGYFHRASNEYRDFTLKEDLEVVSCVGNITTYEGEPAVHAHMIVADEKGKCYGGHLMPDCEVSVTIELVIIESDSEIHRSKDKTTGLTLIDIK